MSETVALVVELCGKLADVHGREVMVPVPVDGCSVDELLDRVRSAFPALAGLLAPGKVRVCRNDEIVPAAAHVAAGDAVALFPPVSGG